jgi:hypothetical protein
VSDFPIDAVPLPEHADFIMKTTCRHEVIRAGNPGRADVRAQRGTIKPVVGGRVK